MIRTFFSLAAILISVFLISPVYAHTVVMSVEDNEDGTVTPSKEFTAPRKYRFLPRCGLRMTKERFSGKERLMRTAFAHLRNRMFLTRSLWMPGPGIRPRWKDHEPLNL